MSSSSSVAAQEQGNKIEPVTIIGTRPNVKISTVWNTQNSQRCGPYLSFSFAHEIASVIACNSDLDRDKAMRSLANFVYTTEQDYQLDRKRTRGADFQEADIAARICVYMKHRKAMESRSSKKLVDKKVLHWLRDDEELYWSDKPGDVNSTYYMSLLGDSTSVLKDTAMVQRVASGLRTLDRNKINKRLASMPRIHFEENHILKLSWGQPDSPFYAIPENTQVLITLLFGSQKEIESLCARQQVDYRER